MDDSRTLNTSLSDDELETMLFALGQHIPWPVTPDLSVPRPESRTPLRWVPRRRSLLVAAAAILVLLGTAFAFSSGVRDTVAELLGVDGLSIEFRDDVSVPPPEPGVASNLSIGSPVTLEEADEQAPFALQIPAVPGVPDASYLRLLPGGDPMVTLVYLPSDAIPETGETGVGLLLMEFQSSFNGPQLIKTLTTDFSYVIDVDVNGQTGFWIGGVSELTILADPSAGVSDDATRPTANVLIWQEGTISFRMESSLSLAAMVEIASSLQPFAS